MPVACSRIYTERMRGNTMIVPMIDDMTSQQSESEFEVETARVIEGGGEGGCCVLLLVMMK